jgi:hypothetical protein
MGHQLITELRISRNQGFTRGNEIMGEVISRYGNRSFMVSGGNEIMRLATMQLYAFAGYECFDGLFSPILIGSFDKVEAVRQ